MATSDLDQLVEKVLESAKYRAVGDEIVRHIGARELAARRNLREAIKATKNKLHQIGGAYLDARPPYEAWLETVAQAAASGDAEQLRTACLPALKEHASTRERVTILEQFYAELWQHIPQPSSLLDVACGLNPLAFPWMQLGPNITYHACDIYSDMIGFIDAFFGVISVQKNCFVCDLVAQPPEQQVDVALALKVLPVLEQRDKVASLRLLRALNARHLVVSYPSASLGGRGKGMSEAYERHFRQLVADEPWSIERIIFANELVFIVEKAIGEER